MRYRTGPQLAAWLLREHPGMFGQLARIANQRQLSGFSDDAGVTTTFDTGDAFTDFAPVSDSVVSTDTSFLTDPSTLDVGSTLQTPGFDIGSAPASDSGGFLSSIGGGLSSALSSVGNFLSSGTGLTAVTNLGTAYFKSQTQSPLTAAQAAVLQAQVARTASGQPAAPITYVTNPTTGQVTPMVRNTYGALVPLTPTALSSLTPSGASISSFVQQNPVAVGLGVLALVALAAFS